jgi:hypothetical protein
VPDIDNDPAAPHGRDDQGVPLAPYGHKVDGTPRVSNRGRSAGPRTHAAPPKKGGRAAPKKQRRPDVATAQLVELVGMVTTPLSAASNSPAVKKRLGERKALALAGNVVIVDAYAEPLAAAVVQLSESKPGLLAWMDQVEEKAPYLALLQVGVQLAKDLIANTMNPNPSLASAGQKLATVKARWYAAAVEAEAAAYADEPEDYDVPTIPEQRAAA